jgi:saccharopepsin
MLVLIRHILSTKRWYELFNPDLDTVTLSPSLVITQQSIGVASFANGFSGVDGILGYVLLVWDRSCKNNWWQYYRIGPVDLTQQTLSSGDTIPTVTDNLISQGTISTEVIGIFYAPASESDSDGELTFGGVDTSKTTSAISYVPITSTSPASLYWGIDQSISYNGKTILSSTAGIVDTGTTLVLIASGWFFSCTTSQRPTDVLSDAYAAYQKATGGTADSTTGLLKITSSQFKALKPLDFIIGGQTYSLSANAQIWPRSLNSQIGGTSGDIYLIVADVSRFYFISVLRISTNRLGQQLGSNSGTGLDFINGYTFLERYYSVFDTTNNRIGFASTSFTTAAAN